MSLMWIVPLGLSVGVVVGSLGAGGGILTVPILVYLLGQEPSAATTGSLVVAGASSLAGVVPHLRRGDVRVADGLLFGVAGVVGAVAGSAANHLVPGPVLMSSFAVLLLAVATLMTVRRRRGARDRAAGVAPQEARRRGWPVVVVAATVVGVLTGFFGVGGGFAVVPALVLVLGFPMRAAVGTSLVVIVVNSLTSLAARAGSGVHVDWALVGTFGIAAAVGSVLAARISGRADPDRLGAAFSALLVVVAVVVAVQNVPLLLR